MTTTKLAVIQGGLVAARPRRRRTRDPLENQPPPSFLPAADMARAVKQDLPEGDLLALAAETFAQALERRAVRGGV